MINILFDVHVCVSKFLNRSYGIQMWGCAEPSNLKTIQFSQSICLRQIVSDPWYAKNINLHDYIKIPTLSQLTKSHFLSIHSKLLHHENPLVNRLFFRTIPDDPQRTLKRSWPKLTSWVELLSTLPLFYLRHKLLLKKLFIDCNYIFSYKKKSFIFLEILRL